MAVEQRMALPPQYVEDLQKDYGKQLTALTAAPLDTGKFAPTVAGQDAYQTQAYNLAGAGIGAYQPYITQASAYTGPTGYQSFMSPYQQDVIDATMTEYDKQAARGMQGIADLATRSGNLGGGREGVALAEYGAASDRDRAALQAQLLQQGFGQAQQSAQQQFANQMGLASALPGLQRGDISTLGSLGALNQAQTQAGLDAQREANRMAAFQPQEQLQQYGNLVTGIMGGMAGSGTQTQQIK